jgi:hypothetical protein
MRVIPIHAANALYELHQIIKKVRKNNVLSKRHNSPPAQIIKSATNSQFSEN